MDELIEKYDNLKISAFGKLRRGNFDIHDVTIGPNSCLEEEKKRISVTKNENETKPTKPKTSTRTVEPVMDLRQLLDAKKMERMAKVQEAVCLRQKVFVEQQEKRQLRLKQQWLAKQKDLHLRIEEREMQIFQALEEHDKLALKQKELRQRYYQQLEEKRKKRDQELQAKEQMKRDLDKIRKNQQEIGSLYNDIINLLKSTTINEALRKTIGEVSQKLKVLNLEMEEITKKCKVGVGSVEVHKSAEILRGMMLLKNEVQTIIDKYNKEKEVKLQQQPVEIVIPTVQKDTTEKPVAKIQKFVSKSSFRLYSELQEFLENHEKSYTDLLGNDSLKQFKFDCKKAVNIPVNAICSVNAQHLQDKYFKLSSLLSGHPVPVGDSQMSAKSHPQGIAFCMDLLAKKFILQGDLMISGNPEAAFCYATIILSLWNDFPTFGKLLLAHFHKQCPYLVPIHLPKSVEQTDEEYYKSLGYQYVDGAVEKQDKYLKRMTGIMRLYSAIITSQPKKSQRSIPHPHGLSQGWRWLTATLNLQPCSDITATLLYVFLETGGSMMQNMYRKEFRKVIGFIVKVYMPLLKKIDSGGPYTRLEVLLQEYMQTGQFPELTGRIPNSYW